MAYMSAEDFNKVVDGQCEYIKATLASKAEEYSTGGDRLHNFNQMARVNETTATKEIWHMAGKHLSCILDMVHGRIEPTEFLINEKFGDMINYLIIQKANLLNELRGGAPGCEPPVYSPIIEYEYVHNFDSGRIREMSDRLRIRRKHEELGPEDPQPIRDDAYVVAFYELSSRQYTKEEWADLHK